MAQDYNMSLWQKPSSGEFRHAELPARPHHPDPRAGEYGTEVTRFMSAAWWVPPLTSASPVLF